ncbi:MAG TPA: YdeI/OmpD-associated family protein [Blastocatellia bacterium]|nr:YdeI/OmpD-associated family protein [Blastocatellia bacterium]
MATTKRFRAVLEKDTDSSATAIAIPFDVEKAYGSRGRVPVRGTLNGFAFRSSVFPMGGGCHWLVVNRDMREGAKIKAGETISVMMERDDEPRVITPPKDFARALAANKAALAAWDKLSYTHRKEYAKAIEEAKKPETRARRIEKTIAALVTPKS